MQYKIPKHTANVISALRVVITLIMLAMIFLNQAITFFWLIVAGYITDILDGFVARTFKLESDLGRNLDTLGDILFFPILSAGTIYFYFDFFYANWEITLLLIFAKLIGYLVVYLKLKRLPTAHLRSAQTWGYWLILLVITLFKFSPQPWILYVMTLHATIFSIEYILFCFALTKPEQENLHSYYALKKSLEQK